MLGSQILYNYNNFFLYPHPLHVGCVVWTLPADLDILLLYSFFQLSLSEQALPVPAIVEPLVSLAISETIALFA